MSRRGTIGCIRNGRISYLAIKPIKSDSHGGRHMTNSYPAGEITHHSMVEAWRNTLKIEELPLLRQSERAAFKRCNWAWFMEYVRRIRPKVELGKEAADFGSLFHIALAEY